ncbi:hypothetical protein [Methanobrevibacter sp. YE315]|uniref:hypothetical protein n=1 Tax=Methanobrevibacter sp. YE315 TaxID=1609968 RepID=UPI001E2BCA7D|nr:hypothetical protein [Methanobrevibacter sp. YE315]
MSREEWLYLLSIKIIEKEDKLYLVDLNETFNQRIYSKSPTDIKRGLNKLKENNKIRFDSKESKNLYDKVIYNLQHKKCAWCGKSFKPKNNADKYCSKDCKKFGKQEKDRDNKWKQRRNPDYHEKRLGNVKLSPHRNPDYEQELKSIKSERRRTLKNYKPY